MEKLLLRIVPDVTAATGLGRTTIFNEISNGRLKSVRVGRSRLVTRDGLNDYVELLKAEADTELRPA